MDRHAQQAVARTARAGMAFVGLVLALASGCTVTDQLVADFTTADKPAPAVTQVAAIWSNQVIAGVDPAHGAAPMYGLAGRVLLYGADFKENLLADGRLVVELYAVPPEQPQSPPVRLESWEITKDILNSVNRRTDGIGQGYSLSLPWPSYRPDITQVQLQVRYEPRRGLPVLTHNAVALSGGPIAPAVYTNRTETGNRQPIATGAPPGPRPQSGTLQPRVGVPPASGTQFPGGLQPVGGTQVTGGMPSAGGMQRPVGATPPGGQFAPACVVEPSSGMPPPGPAPYQTAPQQTGAFQPQLPGQAPYQMPQ